jgi:hypothetical protein
MRLGGFWCIMSSERLETHFAVINQSKEEKSNEKETAS